MNVRDFPSDTIWEAGLAGFAGGAERLRQALEQRPVVVEGARDPLGPGDGDDGDAGTALRRFDPPGVGDLENTPTANASAVRMRCSPRKIPIPRRTG